MATNSNVLIRASKEPSGVSRYGKLLSVLIQLTLLLATTILMFSGSERAGWDSFIFWCRYGTVVSVALLGLYALAAGSLFKPMTLVIVSFIAFQFGVPILYGFVPGYSNWYAGYLNASSLLSSASYTVICIQAFVLGATIAHRVNEDSRQGGSFCRKPLLSDRAAIEQVSTVGFMFTGIIAVPRSLLFYLASSSSGISAARSLYEMGGIDNLARGLFVPFGLLLLVYLTKGMKRNVVFGALFIYSLLYALSGDRTEGLTLMVVLAFWMFCGRTQEKNSVGKAIGLVLSGLAIVWLLAAIADVRVGGNVEGLWLGDAFVSALDEMGFNSLTIGFQMQLTEEPTWGLSYLASLGTLIPSSIDFAGINDLLASANPVNQYYESMSQTYSWASFGLGYSLIAESYSNFGWFGWIAIGLIGALIAQLLHWDESSPFGQYLSLVFLWSFLTLPRRQLSWLANSLEYNLLFILLILWAWQSMPRVRRNRAGRRGLLDREGVI